MVWLIPAGRIVPNFSLTIWDSRRRKSLKERTVFPLTASMRWQRT